MEIEKKSEVSNVSKTDKQVKVQKSTTEVKAEQKGEAPKMEGSERSDIGATLGADNAQIEAVLAEPPGDDVSANYIAHLETILETAGNYMWGMKKHFAADEAAWRELAKRITLLQAEGYDVRAGTKEAKQRRLLSTNVSSLMEKVTKKRKRRSSSAAD
ncbi:hypothetical protein ANCCAN_17071 [Ancylostoma caninum]|uniref:Uncharacterized protein n=1 Tax=Ancylostoma caninum TaxID=29170 RepID=A0A368G253_ANCCA|nr:hypothetical protein ANCCAN_17071 [Ancylostoma caninum]